MFKGKSYICSLRGVGQIGVDNRKRGFKLQSGWVKRPSACGLGDIFGISAKG